MSVELSAPESVFKKSKLVSLGLTDEELTKPLVLVLYEQGCEREASEARLGALTSGCGATLVCLPSLCGCAAEGAGRGGLMLARESIADLTETILGLYPTAAVAVIASSESAAAGMVMGAVRKNIPLAFMPAFLDRVNFPSAVYNARARVCCGKESISALESLESDISCGRGAEMDNFSSLCVFLEGCGLAIKDSVGAFSLNEKITSARRLGSLAASRAIDLSYPRKDLSETLVTAGLAAFIAAGGTAAALLHVLAIACENGISIDLKDVEKLSEKIPLLARVAPIYSASIVDFVRAGGVFALLAQLTKIPKLLPPTLRLGSYTLDSLSDCKTKDENVISKLENPVAEGGFATVRGFVDYGVFRRSVSEKAFKGTAVVFSGEELFKAAVSSRTVQNGSVIVVRGQNAKESGMPLLDLESFCCAAGLDNIVILTDGRVLETCAGGLGGGAPIVISLCCGETMSAIKSGDPIEIDFKKCKISLNVSGKELSTRLKKLRPEDSLSGGLLRYSSLVGDPDNGCALRNKF